MNIVDYVYENPVSFEKKHFNIVDSLILSQLSNIRFESRNLETLSDYNKLEYFSTMFCDSIEDEDNKHLFMAMAISPRYRDIKITNREVRMFDDEQFAAFTFDTGNLKYVSFRGTDGSITGWRENFRLSYMDKIPAQKAALRYLEKERPDYVGGHSKGGNLAAFAGSQLGFANIHCFDSPGFPPHIASELNGSCVTKLIPESSVVGILLEDISRVSYVKSDAFFIRQHSAYSWKVNGNDFERVRRLKPFSEHLKKTTSKWLSGQSEDKKKLLVETFFDVLEENGVERMTDLKGANLKDARNILGSVRDKEVKDEIRGMLREFSRESLHTLTEGIRHR